MALKNLPCAYCGSTSIPRTKGHVIPDCMYPSATDPKVQRRTVPECTECQKIWQDAENQFRNILVVAGELSPPVVEQWEGPIRRSFDLPSGTRWIADLIRQMVPSESSTTGESQLMVYPARDPAVMLVVRKIIRGLSHWHRLGTPIADELVWSDVKRYAIPDYLHKHFQWFSLGDEFLQYGYERTANRELNVHSAWYLKFYGRCEFVGVISYTPLPSNSFAG
jgi:hypothetical protein